MKKPTAQPDHAAATMSAGQVAASLDGPVRRVFTAPVVERQGTVVVMTATRNFTFPTAS